VSELTYEDIKASWKRNAKKSKSIAHLKVVRTKKKCLKCGFKIRGSNHEEGHHHRKGFNGTAPKQTSF